MPTRTARPARTGTRTSTPSRSTTSRRSSTPKRSTPKRTGVAGGFLQRRKAPTSRKSKAVGALKRGLPSSKKGSGVAAGLALLGAAGVALRKRTGGDHSSDVPSTPTTTPVTPAAPATNVTSTPSNTTSPSTDTEFPPAN